MQDYLNVYKYEFKANVKIYRHYYITSILKGIFWTILILLSSMMFGGIITLIIESIKTDVAKFAFVMIIFSVFVTLMSKLCTIKFKDYAYIDDNLNGLVRKNNTGQEIKFSLTRLNIANNIKIIDYTWSHRIKIIIKIVDKHRLIILGDEEANKVLIQKFKRAGFKIKEINDEPSD